MTQDLYWTYALNLIINSFLAFLTIALFIQLLIFIFRVKSPRFKAILLCIPLLKLALDPFLYDFQNWALLHQINPLEAEIGSRTLSVQLFSPTVDTGFTPFASAVRLLVNNGQTFTLADVAALSIAPEAARAIVIIAGLVSLTLLTVYIFRLRRSMKALSHIAKNASPCRRVLQNQQLIHKIRQVNSQLIISSDVEVPCAFGVFRKWICFPAELVNRFTQDEFEAITAHELDHLHWYDGVIRMLCHCFCTVFWWVPTGWWLNRMEFAQEMACDAKVRKFDMTTLDLASAIIKTAKATKGTPCPMFSTCIVQNGLTSKRLQLLLKEPLNKNNKFKWLQIALVGIIAASVFLGRFWIF